MKKRLLLVAALVLALGMFSACGPKEEKPAEGGTTTSQTEGVERKARPEDGDKKILYTSNHSEPNTLDPALAQGTHESWPMTHLYEGMMTYDEEGKVVGGMGEDEYTVSEDGLTYTFKVKDGMKWSNGDPVTAHDFEYSWKRVVDPSLAAHYAFQLFYIEGAEAVSQVEKPGTYYKKDEEGNPTSEVEKVVEYDQAELEGLEVDGKSEDEINEMVYQKRIKAAQDEMGVKALDDKTLEVKLVAPTGYFAELTAFYTYFPINKKVDEENPDWAKDAATFVCNGPFKLTNWAHDSAIDMEKNENYHNADKVKLDGLHFDILEDINTAYQKYEGGEYDILIDPPQTVVAKMGEEKNPELVIGKQVGTYYYNLNTLEKPFDNIKVRKALSMAIDRVTICEKVAQGGQIPATGQVPFGLFDETGKDFREVNGELISNADYAKNVEEAKKLLEEGLKESGMTVEDMNGKILLYNTDEGHKKIAQVVQQMWKEALGFEVQLENVDFNVKLDREKAHDYDISRAGWIGDYADPMTMLDLFVTDGPFNDCAYSNPEYDKLIAESKNSGDQALRMKNMKEAEKILMEEMPIIPVYFYTQPYLTKPYVKGIYKPLLNYPMMTYTDFE